MAEFNISQNDFSRGLVSGKIAGRSDLKDYRSSLSLYQNMLTLPSGGAIKRPGFQYVKSLPYRSIGEIGADTDFATIPFIPDDSNSYLILLPTPQSGTQAPQSASPDVSRNIDIFLADGTTCTVTLTTDASPYAFTGSWPLDLDPRGWRYAQSNDFIFITHSSGSVRPFYIARTGATTFTVALYDANPLAVVGYVSAKVVPYKDTNKGSNTLAYDGAVTVTSIASIFSSLLIGQYIRILDTTNSRYSYFIITATPSGTTATVTPLAGASVCSATTDWAWGAWSSYFGYPTTVSMHNQRLIWGATKSKFQGLSDPDVVWASRVGNFFRMEDNKSIDDLTFTPSSDHAFKFRIAGNSNNFITWMASAQSFQVGTSNEEFIIDFNITEDGSKTVPDVRRQTSHGSVNFQPVAAGYSTLYPTRDRRYLRQFKYNRENGSYIANNLNLLADDLFKIGSFGIKKMVWQESRRILWVLDNSPFIRTLCFDEESGTVAWSLQVFNEKLFIQDLAVLPNDDVGEDEVFAVAWLDDGSDTTVLLKISNYFENGTLETYTLSDRPFFTDCSIRSYDATAKLVHNGFDVLNGQTVAVLANGIYVGDYTVSGGEITLDAEANEVIAGLIYEASLKTLPVEAGGMFGDSVGAVKRIDEISLRFYRSFGAKFGDRIMEEESNLEPIEFDTAKGLFSGLKSVKFSNGYSEDYDAYIVVTQESPTPLMISCITYRGQTFK